ncbi:hypothetical protein GY45DRAFT_1249720, partial [Cubamyces sp. BRFM 1775]
ISLSRTSKTFCVFLMSRRSASLWQATRQRASPWIPESPEEMSEPQYAVLFFTSHCMHCGVEGVKRTIWNILSRYCSECEQIQ